MFADEIVVVDSGSTDRTVEIARSFGARVLVREWPGFAAQKNFAIQQCSGKWVLSLDADEELSVELRTQIRLLLPSNPPADAFFIKRRNLFSAAGSSTAATIRTPSCACSAALPPTFRSKPHFEDRPVHETIVFDGESQTLDFDLIHHAYPTPARLPGTYGPVQRPGCRAAGLARPHQPLRARLLVECAGRPTHDIYVQLCRAARLFRRARRSAAAPVPHRVRKLEVCQGLATLAAETPGGRVCRPTQSRSRKPLDLVPVSAREPYTNRRCPSPPFAFSSPSRSRRSWTAVPRLSPVRCAMPAWR